MCSCSLCSDRSLPSSRAVVKLLCSQTQCLDTQTPGFVGLPLYKASSQSSRHPTFTSGRQKNGWKLLEVGHGGVLKWWYRQITNFDTVFYYKPSILGYHHLRKHPYLLAVRLWDIWLSYPCSVHLHRFGNILPRYTSWWLNQPQNIRQNGNLPQIIRGEKKKYERNRHPVYHCDNRKKSHFKQSFSGRKNQPTNRRQPVFFSYNRTAYREFIGPNLRPLEEGGEVRRQSHADCSGLSERSVFQQKISIPGVNVHLVFREIYHVWRVVLVTSLCTQEV